MTEMVSLEIEMFAFYKAKVMPIKKYDPLKEMRA